MTDTIKRLRERLAKATPGRYYSGHYDTCTVRVRDGDWQSPVAHVMEEDDARLIVGAINALPALLDVAEAAQQAYKVDAVADWFDAEGDGLKAALAALEKVGE